MCGGINGGSCLCREGRFSPGAQNESQSRSTGKVLIGVIRWRDATSPVMIVRRR